MYHLSENARKEDGESSLKLDEIPGLLSIKKVKPKDDVSKKKTKITSAYGSIEGKDILSKVEILHKEKEQKKRAAEDRKEKRNNDKEFFFPM